MYILCMYTFYICIPFLVALGLILFLFWITQWRGALHSFLSLGSTKNRIQSRWDTCVTCGCDLTTLNVLTCMPACERPCEDSRACWPVSAPVRTAMRAWPCICAHGAEGFMAVKRGLPLWSVTYRHNWMRAQHCPGCRWAFSTVFTPHLASAGRQHCPVGKCICTFGTRCLDWNSSSATY